MGEGLFFKVWVEDFVIFLFIFGIGTFDLLEISPLISFLLLTEQKGGSFFRWIDWIDDPKLRKLMCLNFTIEVDSISFLFVSSNDEMVLSQLSKDYVFSFVLERRFNFLKPVQKGQTIFVMIICWRVVIDEIRLESVFFRQIYHLIEFVTHQMAKLWYFYPILFSHLRRIKFFQQG